MISANAIASQAAYSHAFEPDAVPNSLRAIPHWVCWRVEYRDGRATKVPLDPRTGRHASSTDPSSWAEFDRAVEVASRNSWGIGFVFSDLNPFAGIDLDKCIDLQTSNLDQRAALIVKRFDTYTEISPSGTGVKLFVRAKFAGKGRKRGGIECYCRGRFFTVTGRRLPESPADVAERHTMLAGFIAAIFPERTRATVAAAPRRLPVASDHGVIERALAARNGGAFGRLWRGEWQAAGYTSQSEADLALLSYLAFWTNRDRAQMKRLFELSGLCREKWTRRPDYREATLAKALSEVGHA